MKAPRPKKIKLTPKNDGKDTIIGSQVAFLTTGKDAPDWLKSRKLQGQIKAHTVDALGQKYLLGTVTKKEKTAYVIE